MPKPAWNCLAPNITADSRQIWPEVGLFSLELSYKGLLIGLQETAASTVILHYVGFGYHHKGCPVWLAPALQEWKRRSGGKLIVMFHELYAKGSPRHSSYWLSPIARKIMVDLVGTADKWITNCVAAEEKLLRETKADPSCGKMIPVGSNIPLVREVSSLKPWPLSLDRKLEIIVFGLPGTRRRALEAHQNLIRCLCQRGLVEHITIAGKASEIKDDRLTTSLISKIGFEELWCLKYGLSSQHLSELFLEQDLGLTPNFLGILTKSGVYAAFCSHNVLAVALEGKRNTKSIYPAILNDDTQPDSCIEQILDASAMNVVRQRVNEITKTTLNWDNIVREWQECIA